MKKEKCEFCNGKAGLTEIENGMTLCWTCNNKLQDQMMEEVMAEFIKHAEERMKKIQCILMKVEEHEMHVVQGYNEIYGLDPTQVETNLQQSKHLFMDKAIKSMLKKKGESTMKTMKFLIADENDGFYDIYLFKEPVVAEDVKKVVELVKKTQDQEWTLEDIKDAIEHIFPVKEVIGFDYNVGDAMEV